MKITVRYFAHLKDRLKRNHDEFEVGCEASPEKILRLIFSDRSEYERAAKHLRVAINADYAAMNEALHDGDDVVFIPPVAGG